MIMPKWWLALWGSEASPEESVEPETTKTETKTEKVKRVMSKEIATAPDYKDLAGVGFEDVTNDDLALPFFTVLQSNSPQVADETVEGAKAGMFYDTVGDQLFPGELGIVLQPVAIDHALVEWIPQNSGGGFVARHDWGTGEAYDYAMQKTGGPVSYTHLTLPTNREV